MPRISETASQNSSVSSSSSKRYAAQQPPPGVFPTSSSSDDRPTPSNHSAECAGSAVSSTESQGALNELEMAMLAPLYDNNNSRGHPSSGEEIVVCPQKNNTNKKKKRANKMSSQQQQQGHDIDDDDATSSSAASEGHSSSNSNHSASLKNRKKMKALPSTSTSPMPVVPRVEPPSAATLASGVPPKLVVVVFVAVVGVFLYGVISLLAGAAGTSSPSQSCNSLQSAMGVRCVPYRVLFVASVVSVLINVVINTIKYRGAEQEQQQLAETQAQTQTQTSSTSAGNRKLKKSNTAVDHNNNNNNEGEAEAEEEEEESSSVDEASSTVSGGGGGGGGDQQLVAVPSSSSSSTFGDEATTAVSLLKGEHLQHLRRIRNPLYFELAWLMQTYGSVDARWWCFVFVFAVVNWFAVLASVVSSSSSSSSSSDSGGGSSSPLASANAWEKYQALFLRWFNSGTVPVLGVLFAQLLPCFVCFEIAGTPAVLSGDDEDKRNMSHVIANLCLPLSTVLSLGGDSNSKSKKLKKKNSNKDDSSSNNKRAIKSNNKKGKAAADDGNSNIEQLGFIHLFVGCILMYPAIITHVVPSLLIFLPMTVVFAVPPLVCVWVARREFAPFVALLEDQQKQQNQQQRDQTLHACHRRGVILMVFSARVIGVFIVAALFQTMSSYSAMFFKFGGGSWGHAVSAEVLNRDLACFLKSVNEEGVYKMIMAGLVLS